MDPVLEIQTDSDCIAITVLTCNVEIRIYFLNAVYYQLFIIEFEVQQIHQQLRWLQNDRKNICF